MPQLAVYESTLGMYSIGHLLPTSYLARGEDTRNSRVSCTLHLVSLDNKEEKHSIKFFNTYIRCLETLTSLDIGVASVNMKPPLLARCE
jgi:hypothetical protein